MGVYAVLMYKVLQNDDGTEAIVSGGEHVPACITIRTVVLLSIMIKQKTSLKP
jgi:hypothetical protein